MEEPVPILLPDEGEEEEEVPDLNEYITEEVQIVWGSGVVPPESGELLVTVTCGEILEEQRVDDLCQTVLAFDEKQ